MSEVSSLDENYLENGGARDREGVIPAHPGGPESAGEVIRKIRKILDDAFKDPRRYKYGLKLLFYGEPHVTWIPTDYPPKMEKVWYYPHLVCVEIQPVGGRLQVKVSEGVNPLVFFCETWKEAFDYIAKKVAELCNHSITRAEIVYTASDVIWRRD